MAVITGLLRSLALCLLLTSTCHSLKLGPAPGQLRLGDGANEPPTRPPSKLNALHAFNVSHASWQHDSSATLIVDLDVFESSGWFTVSWRSVPDPNYDDLIALYVPADADITKTAPVKFKFCVQANPDHVNSGTGTARFWLLNYRQDMSFVLMRGGLAHPTAVARSRTVRVLNPNQPLQGRLARTQDPTQMLIQWTTHNSSQPQVRWGPHPHTHHLPHTTPATSSSYTREDMCGGVATSTGWIHAGTHHRALLTGLTPGRRYTYSFGDPSWGFSQARAFTAAPPPEAAVHVLLVADVGQAERDGSNQAQETMLASLNTSARMEAEAGAADYSLLLHPGDLSYAEGFGGSWDNYFTQMEPITTRMPYMVASGNHERDWPGSPGDRWGVEDSGGECGVPYEHRLSMPSPGPDQPWYSFDHGPVHFLQYSTEHAFEAGSPQHAFLLADLQAVDRAVTPWLVVSGHRPMYISSTNQELPDGDQPVAALLRGELEQLLVEHRVDLTFAGHHHTYQRTCPVVGQECVGFDADGHARGPVHLVIGHGGAPLSFNMQEPAPGFLERSVTWWGYVRLHASRTELHVEVVSDLDGGLSDELRLAKRGAWGEEFMLRKGQRGEPSS